MSPLPTGYEIREMPQEEFQPLWQKLAKEVFAETSIFNLQDALSEEENSKMLSLQQKFSSVYRLNLGLFYREEFVGWATGNQEMQASFYMRNSAVLSAHRRKGLYTHLLQRMLALTAQQGFQKIYSRHTAANNPVIIPKLKAGFNITALEISDIFGALVHLSYFPNPIRLKMLSYRTGEIKPDDEIRKLLKF
jgi:L-amino acid N-acyltransferase YncA